MDTIKLELSYEECELFKKFQEYHDAFQILVDAGVFTIKQGSVNVHFDNKGDVGTVEIHHHTYRRRYNN